MRGVFFAVTFAVLLVLTFPVLMFGQAETTGRIAGVVTDASKAFIPGVTIIVEGQTLFQARTTITAEDASYFIDKLPPGVYSMKFTFPGFKTVERNDVGVRAGFTASINATLDVGTVQETVLVTEEAPVVDVRSATTATTFDSELLKDIPSGRDMWSTLAQVPGLTPSKFDVGGSESFQQTSTQVHGSRLGQTVYSVNGLNLNWPGGNGGSTAFYFDNEAFEEIQVVTDAAQAEIGVGGAYINMITKQGSNELHGAVKGFYTTAKLTSKPSYPIFAGNKVEAGTTITMMRDTNVQMSLPIIKDRMWWFSGYRRYDINLAVPGIKRQDGSAIKDNNHQGDVTARMDISINPRQKVSLNWLYNDINRFYRRTANVNFQFEDASTRQLEHAWIGQGQWTYTPTSSLVLDTRYGQMILHNPQVFQPSVVPGTIAVFDTVLSTLKYAAPQSSINSTRHRRFAQNASYYKAGWLRASHNVRGGVEYARLSNGRWTRIYRDLTVTLANGQPLYATINNTPIHAIARSHETALYLQDSIVVGRLTINGGARFDRFITYNPAQTSPAGNFAGERSFPRSANIVNWINVSPRFGVAFDMTGKGRAVLRGSFSRFVLLEGSGLADSVNPNAINSTNVPFVSLSPDNYPLGMRNPIFKEGGSFTTIQPNMKRPYSDQAAAGYEQQLIGDFRAALGYFYRTTKSQYARRNRAALPSDYTPVSATNPLTKQPITVYSQAKAKVGLADYLISTSPELDDNAYHGLEVNGTKRLSKHWQVLSGLTVQRWKGSFSRGAGDDFNNPNLDIYRKDSYLENDSTYVFKLAGTYSFPMGLSASANVQHYTGYPIQPAAVFASGLNQGNVTVVVEPRGVERFPNVNVLNLRFSYARSGVGIERVRMEPTFDVYNVFNANTITAMVQTVGPNYRKPSGILGQRFVRFGLQIEF